ncbi:hypothetical protein [Actinophytocola gossypii]|uniref:Uncharacterized protein n=1 Tax=Actinophytocola gossypii TaxID=2812003 RepID=A0ABT2J1I8_9PSEU|nr:hypothetical protein [Actinophytocola gossypii]MCT2581723.1 hypothetical protein [Actinophytocola gossypii]
MTQPYGGQQPQQPGGHNPGSGGFQQPGGQYPNSGGMPPAPGYGGMPQASQEYTSGPIPRPGVATTAGVLAYVQAGITAITTILVWTGVPNLEGTALLIQLMVALAQTAGVVLLILGGLQLMSGKSRTLLVVAAIVEIAICLFYMIVYSTLDSGGIDMLEGAKAVLIGSAIFFAIMPVIALVMAMNAQTTQFLQSRRLPRQ